MTAPFEIRPAAPSDVVAIAQLVRDLAAYEREPDAAQATPEDLHEALFGDDRSASCLIATVGDTPVALALWFRTFSTWTGRPGIYLEDLFVQPDHRGSGIGTALLAELARTCQERGWTRLEWEVLDWNAPSIAFYESLGAVPQSGWTAYRLSGDALTSLATD